MSGPVVLAVDQSADGWAEEGWSDDGWAGESWAGDVPTGDSRAVAWAASEAALRGTELRLLNACGTAAPDYATQLLDALASGLRERVPGLLAVNVEVVPGNARDVLTAAADSAELLVVGTRGSGGFPGLLVGSTTLHVAGTAACPVAVVPDRDDAGRTGVGTVVAGVDAKDPDDAVLDFAFATAQRRELPLRAVHAWRYPLISQGRGLPPVYERGHIDGEEQRLLAEVLAGRRERFPSVDVRGESVKSGAARALVAASDGADLLVVGRHGRPSGPLARLGSVSLAVVQHARCPVAVIPVG